MNGTVPERHKHAARASDARRAPAAGGPRVRARGQPAQRVPNLFLRRKKARFSFRARRRARIRTAAPAWLLAPRPPSWAWRCTSTASPRSRRERLRYGFQGASPPRSLPPAQPSRRGAVDRDPSGCADVLRAEWRQQARRRPTPRPSPPRTRAHVARLEVCCAAPQRNAAALSAAFGRAAACAGAPMPHQHAGAPPATSARCPSLSMPPITDAAVRRPRASLSPPAFSRFAQRSSRDAANVTLRHDAYLLESVSARAHHGQSSGAAPYGPVAPRPLCSWGGCVGARAHACA